MDINRMPTMERATTNRSKHISPEEHTTKPMQVQSLEVRQTFIYNYPYVQMCAYVGGQSCYALSVFCLLIIYGSLYLWMSKFNP